MRSPRRLASRRDSAASAVMAAGSVWISGARVSAGVGAASAGGRGLAAGEVWVLDVSFVTV